MSLELIGILLALVTQLATIVWLASKWAGKVTQRVDSVCQRLDRIERNINNRRET